MLKNMVPYGVVLALAGLIHLWGGPIDDQGLAILCGSVVAIAHRSG